MSVNNPLLSNQTLGIIYCVLARGTVVLAHQAAIHGNFSEVTQQVLANIPADVDGKLTYASGEYVPLGSVAAVTDRPVVKAEPYARAQLDCGNACNIRKVYRSASKCICSLRWYR